MVIMRSITPFIISLIIGGVLIGLSVVAVFNFSSADSLGEFVVKLFGGIVIATLLLIAGIVSIIVGSVISIIIAIVRAARKRKDGVDPITVNKNAFLTYDVKRNKKKEDGYQTFEF